MPFAQSFPLGGNGDILMDLIRRVEVLEGRARVISNGAIVFTDTAGDVRLLLGQLADGTYGLQVLDAAGHEEVRLGQLHASPDIYGLGVAPATGSAAGTLQQVGGSISASTAAQQTTASTTWTDFGDDPTVTAEIGPSGVAQVTIGVTISTSADVNSEGLVGIRVDGATSPTGNPLVLSQGSATGVNGSLASTQLVPGLSTGTHTFSLLYETANVGAGHNIGFARRFVLVQPL